MRNEDVSIYKCMDYVCFTNSSITTLIDKKEQTFLSRLIEYIDRTIKMFYRNISVVAIYIFKCDHEDISSKTNLTNIRQFMMTLKKLLFLHLSLSTNLCKDILVFSTILRSKKKKLLEKKQQKIANFEIRN